MNTNTELRTWKGELPDLVVALNLVYTKSFQ